VSATVGRDHVENLVPADSHPLTVHFDFVVVVNYATLGRTTIHVIAARAAVFLQEVIVKTTMPFLVADAEIPFLGGCG
jgi:hypothetical protein